jgi:hypothetical protein
MQQAYDDTFGKPATQQECEDCEKDRKALEEEDAGRAGAREEKARKRAIRDAVRDAQSRGPMM